jgi:S1-C subfamily serine protease
VGLLPAATVCFDTMDTAHSESGGWDCPACDRRVPGRIRACRCGFEQPSADAADRGATTARPWATGLPLLGVGLVLGAALALYPWQKAPAAAASQPVASAAPAAVAVHVPEFSDPAPVETAREAGTPAPEPTVEPTIDKPEAPKLEDLVSRVVPAVAFVQAGQNRGTGFFIARDKLLTNAHVVGGQSSVRLQLGETTYSARVVSVSTGSDLAVLQVYNASPTQAVLSLGSVSAARVGEEVIAVGSALGVLSNTVTRGIISAVRRAGPVTLIQTDAAINPGNSGGPLVNRAGQVIGINSLRAGQQAEGVAFAVAIDHATQLLNGERVTDTQTPLGSLTQMLDGRSDTDQQRAKGEQDYGRLLETAARAANELDSFWDRYADDCVASAPAAGDRDWFAIYTAGAVRLGNSQEVDCPRWYDAMKTRADAFRVEIEKAAELARQRGVFPGTARDLRRRYKLQWSGWDR